MPSDFSGTMTPLRVSLIAPAFTYVPMFAAQRRGFFERQGVTCTYDFLGSGDAVTEALKAGSIHFAPNTPEGTLADRASGGPLVILAGLTNKLPFRLIGLERHATRESLRGGTIGVSSLNEGTVHVIQGMLSGAGLQYPGDYELKVVGAHPRRWELLQSGEIDAGLQLTPYDHIAIEAGFSDLGDPNELFPHFAFGVVAANRDWAAENSDVTVAVLKALLDATEWVHTHPDLAADVLVEETGTARRLADVSMRSLIEGQVLPRDLAADFDGLDLVLRIMRQNGELPRGAPMDPAFYVDTQYLEQAQHARPAP